MAKWLKEPVLILSNIWCIIASMEFIDLLNAARSSGKTYAFAVITAAQGGTPRHPGAKMVIYEDGTLAGTIGGGEIEQNVIADALNCISSRKPLMKTYDVIQSGGLVSGSETIYIEPAFPPVHLILCGAGHVAGKLIPLVKTLGFRVTVIDIRDMAIVRERASAADEFILAPSFADGLARIPESEDQFLIACAFNFEQDENILYHLIQRKSAYIGMLAGKYKVQTIYNHLRERGVPDERLNSVHAPIGLEIAAETPEEIALSIAAELVLIKNSR